MNDDNVKRLRDQSEITTLLYQLGAALDEKRFDDLREIYTPQAVFDFAGSPKTGDLDSAIAGGKDMGARFAHTHHVMTNPIVELNGDTARVRANLIATHVYRADAPERHYTAGMVYHFTAVRIPDGWRFSHVKLERIWRSGQLPD
jgi:3-phenylpropionate/cinnamic acid dioxygenase small subunit